MTAAEHEHEQHPDSFPGAILDETVTLGGLLNPLVVFEHTALDPWWTLPLDVLAERLSAKEEVWHLMDADRDPSSHRHCRPCLDCGETIHFTFGRPAERCKPCAVRHHRDRARVNPVRRAWRERKRSAPQAPDRPQ